MTVKVKENLNIDVSQIEALAGVAIAECYGVKAMSAYKVKEGIDELMNKDTFEKGVVAKIDNNEIIIDAHVEIASSLRINEVVRNIQERVKYSFEKVLSLKVKEVNVFIEGIK